SMRQPWMRLGESKQCSWADIREGKTGPAGRRLPRPGWLPLAGPPLPLRPSPCRRAMLGRWLRAPPEGPAPWPGSTGLAAAPPPRVPITAARLPRLVQESVWDLILRMRVDGLGHGVPISSALGIAIDLPHLAVRRAQRLGQPAGSCQQPLRLPGHLRLG